MSTPARWGGPNEAALGWLGLVGGQRLAQPRQQAAKGSEAICHVKPPMEGGAWLLESSDPPPCW